MKAAENLTRATRERYYDAPTEIRRVKGVQHKQIDAYRDSYRGTATALAQTGLLPLDRFPGRDGQNTHSAAFRPSGAKKEKMRGWCYVPGHMVVQRQPGDVYRIVVMVSDDERKRRLAREEAIEAAGVDAAELVLQNVSRHVREYINEAICTQGFYSAINGIEHFFRDGAYLAKSKVSPEGAQKVLCGVHAFRVSEEKRAEAIALERELDRCSMEGVRAALAQALTNENNRLIDRLGDL